MATKNQPGGGTRARKRKKIGRPPHVPTPAQRAAVDLMIAGGIEQVHIARWLRISERSFRTHYKREIQSAAAQTSMRAVGTLARFAFGAAKEYNDRGQELRAEVAPNLTALIFWCKARLGWRDNGGGAVTFDPNQLPAGTSAAEFSFKLSRADSKV